jgi:hypothetical protein
MQLFGRREVFLVLQAAASHALEHLQQPTQLHLWQTGKRTKQQAGFLRDAEVSIKSWAQFHQYMVHT